LNRYPLSEFSENVYYFNIEEIEASQYEITFASSTHYLPTNLLDIDIYEISFNKIGEFKIPSIEIGQRVQLTISYAIANFISKMNCPLLFICDSLDGIERYRLRRFKSWYDKLEDRDNYTFEVRELYSEAEDFTYYSGLIVQNNHAYFDQIINEFDSPKIFCEKG
jgi:hypothetical protein